MIEPKGRKENRAKLPKMKLAAEFVRKAKDIHPQFKETILEVLNEKIDSIERSLKSKRY